MSDSFAILTYVIEGILKDKLKQALKALGIEGVKPALEYPADLSHGDFATNVAMAAVKRAGMNPKELAEKIVVELGAIEHISKIEVAGPGFINFTLAREYYSHVLKNIGISWGRNETLKGEKVGIEYYQPNYFKALHVGHLMNAAVGESLARFAEFSGAKVYRIAYYADIGPHIAKALWGLMKLGIEPTTPEELSKAYEYGSKHYKEDESSKAAIDRINQEIYAGENDAVQTLFRKGSDVSKKQIDELRARLGLTFDKTFFESEGGPVGAALVKEHLGTIFEKSEGAVIFPGEKYGLHTRVFLTSKALPVYETKDLGLAKLKLDALDATELLYVVDVEQTQYFEVVLKAIQLVFPELSGKVRHISHGRLRLPTGRISSREGNIILASDILDELKESVLERTDDAAIAEQVAQAALRYLILRQSLGGNIVFNKEQALSFEGDSGPYLQYSYVRAKSVLEKNEKGEREKEKGENAPKHIPEFERLLPRFPTVVERAAREYEPHYVTTYLTELAGAFNSWYAAERIIGSEHEAYKLALTRAFAQTVKNGLWLLGIEAPELM